MWFPLFVSAMNIVFSKNFSSKIYRKMSINFYILDKKNFVFFLFHKEKNIVFFFPKDLVPKDIDKFRNK